MWLLGGCGGQKRVLDALGLELQMGVSHLVGAGAEPRSSAREAGLLGSQPCLQSLLPFPGTALSSRQHFLPQKLLPFVHLDLRDI